MANQVQGNKQTNRTASAQSNTEARKPKSVDSKSENGFKSSVKQHSTSSTRLPASLGNRQTITNDSKPEALKNNKADIDKSVVNQQNNNKTNADNKIPDLPDSNNKANIQKDNDVKANTGNNIANLPNISTNRNEGIGSTANVGNNIASLPNISTNSNEGVNSTANVSTDIASLPKLGTSNNPWATGREDIMLYGDPVLNRIVAMKPSTMEQIGNIEMPGQEIYAADHITDDKSYVMARGSNFMNILTRDPQGEFKYSGQIDLPFHPRTGAKNLALGLNLVTGTDKPMFSLVDMEKDRSVLSGGQNVVTQGSVGNFDGELATGHGSWLNDSMFVVPDRANRLLDLWEVTKGSGEDDWNVNFLDSINTPTSVHTIHGGSDPNTFYIPIEGSPKDDIPAGLGEVILDGNKLSLGRVVNVPGNDIASQGTHHPAFHPDGQHIYLGSNEGNVHIVDSQSMEIVKTVPAGKGAGHVTFVPERNLALVTNHHDNFVTAIDMNTHSHLKDIYAADDSPQYNTALQAHTGRVSPDKQYFYNFASDSGTFFRINLDTLTTDAQTYTGGTPKQASQPGELTYGVQLGEDVSNAHIH